MPDLDTFKDQSKITLIQPQDSKSIKAHGAKKRDRKCSRKNKAESDSSVDEIMPVSVTRTRRGTFAQMNQVESMEDLGTNKKKQSQITYPNSKH